MGFFSRRRKRERAIPESTEASLGSFADPEGRAVVGEQIGDGQPSIEVEGMSADDAMRTLAQLGPMIQQAMATGNVQISQGEPQVLDMRGSGLREEILQIMEQNGIDPESQTAQNVDASAYGDMQQQIMEALAKHGVDVPGRSPQPPQDSSSS